MKKLNRKGFTLIELLAVITIMGILLLVAIPAISRTIENSRRDTYVDVAKTYINTVRNAVLADELTCGTNTSVGATANGTYHFDIKTGGTDATSTQTRDLMESGGLSSWSNSNVEGYVVWTKSGSGERTTTSYSVFLVDEGGHGIEGKAGSGTSITYSAVAENDLSRSKVSTKTDNKYGSITATAPGTACTLK